MMANIFTKQISPISIGVIGAIIFAVVYLVGYFSPQGTCERKARSDVYRAAAVANIDEVNPMYKTILDGMIEDEVKKCMEER